VRTAALEARNPIQLIHQLALFDFEAFHGSARWRTYIALHATFMSLAKGELRDQVQEALSHSEQVHTSRVAISWKQLAGLFGYRPRSEPQAWASGPCLPLGMVGIATALLEPDPEVERDDERLSTVRRALNCWFPPGTKVLAYLHPGNSGDPHALNGCPQVAQLDRRSIRRCTPAVASEGRNLCPLYRNA
jgi:hypothetical protein